MPLRSDWSQANCPIARSLDIVGDAWTLVILREAFLGLTRYDQFRERLAIADNVLSRRLQAMVDNDLLVKIPYRGDQRTHEEYRLTQAGSELLPVLHALGNWGSRNTETPQSGGRTRIIHLPCGEATQSTDRCTTCDVPLVAGEVAWDRPWAHREAIRLASPYIPA